MKRQRLGQHFLKSKKIARLVVDAAQLTKRDTVLEIGTGRGILTGLLCEGARRVVSVESDKKLYADAAGAMGGLANLSLVCGDGFKTKEKFTVFVSNLPYSESKKAIEWLVQRNFSRGVVMVQKEFAQKLAAVSAGDRKAISVLARHSFDIKEIARVQKSSFDPAPTVDSVILELKKIKTLPHPVIKTVNRIFSYRRKTLQNILVQFGKRTNDQRRLADLTGDEIIGIARHVLR